MIDLNKLQQPCSCQKEHKLTLKTLIIKSGAINLLPDLLKGYKNILVISDENTNKAFDNKLKGLLNCDEFIFSPLNLHADETAVKTLKNFIKKDYDLFIAAGSGTIHDITRFVCHELKVPFLSFPTAPSVDGFVSSVAAMTWEGLKITFPSSAPIGVVADSDIFSNAPFNLIASGFSDLLGKITALVDWKIANIVTGEYFCDSIANLEIQALKTVYEKRFLFKENDKKACEDLMEGLILSGLAMQMIGNSRPASGAEHHLSHLWEMHVINNETTALHGEKVGVGLVQVCDVYKKVLNYSEKNISDKKEVNHNDLKEIFKELYEGIKKENTPDPLTDIRKEDIINNLNKIKSIIEKIPSKKEIIAILKDVGAPFSMKQIGLDDNIVVKSLKFSPFVRRRLTFMRIYNGFFSD